MLQRRIWEIGFCCAVAVLFSITHSQTAQGLDYPTKPVTVINPGDVGGSTDVLFRTIVALAEKHLGQRLVVEMKPGGTGAIGAEFVARAAPDGYTVLAGSPNWLSVSPAIRGVSKGPDDLAGVCRISSAYGFILVRTDAPFKTYQELIEAAKAKPGELIFGNTGPWGLTDLLWKFISHKTGIKFRNVPHQGGGRLLLALLGGQVQVAAMTPNQSLPHIQAGKLRPVLWIADKPHPDFPGLPISKDVDLDFTFPYWQGIAAPKGVPRPILEKLGGAFKKMTEDPEVVKAIQALGSETAYLGPEEFSKWWKGEYEMYKELGKIYKE